MAAVVPGGSAVTPRDPAALADLQLVAARREAIADEVIRLTLTSRTGERLPAWMPGAKRFAPVIDRAVAARGAAFTVELARSHRALHVANGRRESSEVHC